MADSLPVPDFGIDAHAARVYQRFVAAGQGHVFAFWNRLETDQRANFIQQLEALDLDRVARLAALINQPPASADDDANSTGDTWTAPGVIEPPRTDDERAAWAEAREQGELLLRSGRVAALTVAGGQASRLGHNAPKGCLPFGPVTGCSLFEVFAAQIRAARERYGVQMPWMLMTSPANHDDTVAFFASHEHFGLDPSRIRFFRQATLPALDDNGRLLLEAPDRIFEAPDGHGGVLTAMRRHALLGWLAGLRCDNISYFQVDNPQVRLADPVFIGLHSLSSCEFSTRVVEKTDAAERVGLVVRRAADGRTCCIEYSDLPADVQALRDADGRLRYRAANTAIHLLDVSFVVEITNESGAADRQSLPLHVAHKQVPCLDVQSASGQQEARVIEPSAPNAYKFEQFIFDAMPLSARCAVLQVGRESDFLPVKSAEGKTSPAEVRKDYQRYWARALAALGVNVPCDAEGVPVHPLEVAPRYLLDDESHASLAERVKSRPLDVSGPLLVD